MKYTFDNIVLSSFLLYLDHEICNRGSGYQNVTTPFYPTDQRYNGYYTYSAPYKQIVIDSSLPGANLMTGVYIGDTFVRTGESGLADIDYENGRLYFSTQPTANVSGAYAIKDFNICLTSNSDEEIIFVNKLNPRPKVNSSSSGLFSEEKTFPLIYLKKDTSDSRPFAFGGTKMHEYSFKAVVFSDNQFKLDAVESICLELSEKYIPLLSPLEFPFNGLGGLRSGVYDYDVTTTGKIFGNSGVFIKTVYTTKLNRNVYNLKDINSEAKIGIVYFDIEAVRL